MQDSFLRVIQRASGFRQEAKFSTWLFTLVRNVCIDHHRKMRFRNHASLDAAANDEDGSTISTRVDRVAGAEVAVDRHAAGPSLRDRMARAVADLPDEQREVFLLRHVQELSFSEIAGIVAAPENTVKSRMRYALVRLQETLSELREYVEAAP